jgi:CheY-like chemotaxis protein
MAVQLLKNKHIFIVEDDALNRLIYRLILPSHGAKVDFESGAQNVVARLLQLGTVNLVILDLMLSRGVSGFAVAEAIRATPTLNHLPIVAVSATDPTFGVIHAQEKGLNGFIAKPIDDDLFPKQLNQILQGAPLWYVGPLSHSSP